VRELPWVERRSSGPARLPHKAPYDCASGANWTHVGIHFDRWQKTCLFLAAERA
jgi:hypothetical protein